MVEIPNTLLTPALIARESLARLTERSVLVNLVHRDYDADFAGQQGATVNVRKPATFTVDEFDRTAGRQVQNATESPVPVVLDKLPDVSFAVTTEELTLSIQDFGDQFLDGAVAAIREWLESLIISALQAGVTQEVGTGNAVSGDPRELDYHATKYAIIDARKTLNQAKVSDMDRYAVWGPESEATLLEEDLFVHADKRGDTEGLREANLGRKFGFDHFSTSLIPAPAGSPSVGDPTTEVNVAFHRTAIALATRTPAEPLGLPADKFDTVQSNGIGLRVTFDWDGNKKQDVVSLDLLAGAKVLDPVRAVLMKGADATS